ncbi:CmpA/NrtA family ABC transporter substrate-binding protein [Luteimonas kalidii]|uniref:CmpA/NrtA family ABC transporter substrate-binding protein n=1 Tax=Luteimonas kalidii TaxID=3042025 RepID=A0ABT6JWE4_9GAMM|nr:CmpA/NrtA family ABC transporter substrate-binding protein [Luteimonas kalidii]MDH5835008.1 CmpA/NrtA family ABC transporter substrate-binding protein [Luteimonas kalidii]
MTRIAGTLRPLRLGYMPLVDCAPLVVAVRMGFDRTHGLQLELRRQGSWAAVRDKLLSGELDAAHALAGMVYGVDAGIGGPQAPMAVLMVLNQNGQAIVLAPEAAQRLRAGATLREALDVPARRPQLAQTFPTGTHAMWLYYWLAAQGIDPLHEVQALTLPPPEMPTALARGEIQGYCAGEPWAAQAEALGAGARVIRSGEIWPGHPEKVLACRRAFAALEPEAATALTAAVLEACRWLDEDPDHRAQAAQWLADDGAIDLPVASLVDCLLPPDTTPRVARLRFHGDGEVNFPWLSDGRWFLHQFRRWGWLGADATGDDARLEEIHRLDSYRLAALQVGVPLPRGETRTSVLFDGMRWD